MILTKFNTISDVVPVETTLAAFYEELIFPFPDVPLLDIWNIQKQINESTDPAKIKKLKGEKTTKKGGLANYSLCTFHGSRCKNNIYQIYGIQIDIDNYVLTADEKTDIKQKLADKAALVFESPSGGIKAFYQFDAPLDDYSKSEFIWDKVAAKVKAITKQKVDYKTKPACTVCYTSNDQNAIYKPFNMLLTGDYLKDYTPEATPEIDQKKSKKIQPWTYFRSDILESPEFYKLDIGAKMLYFVLRLRACYDSIDRKNRKWKETSVEAEITNKEIIKLLGCCRQTVSRYMDSLHHVGRIDIISKGMHDKKTNVYKKTKFRLSDRWKHHGTDKFKKLGLEGTILI